MISHVTINSRECCYETEGEGFPLVLVPDERGRIADWTPQMPLLGELCRVVAYEYCPHTHSEISPQPAKSDMRVGDLVTLLRVLEMDRVYLAGYAGGGQTALHFALRYPEHLEGLLLIGMAGPASVPEQHQPSCARDGIEVHADPLEAKLSEVSIPTLVLAGADASAHLSGAIFLTTLQRGTKTVIPKAEMVPHREQPLQLGHAMMDFLIQCERQRNLVRGASFLL